MLSGVVKNALRTAQSMLSQIVVSVAAAVCVAFITNAYLERDNSVPRGADAEVERAARAVHDAPVAERAAGGQSRPASAPERARTAYAEPAPADAELPRLEPVLIPDLPQPVAAVETPEIFPGATAGMVTELEGAAREQPPGRLLGVPLPRVVPFARGVAQSIGSATDRVVSVVPGFGARGEADAN